MAKRVDIRGIIVATLTPYDSAGRVDLGLVREHAAFLVERGIEGLAPVGTTGEFLYLTEAEKVAIVRATIAGAGGKARVIAGIWALAPDEVARLGRAAEEAGAHAVFLTTPVYYRYSEAALFDWYRHAAAATHLPLFAYNIPAYSGNEIPLPLLDRLLEEGTAAGIKDSTASAERLGALVERCRGRAAVYGASDSFGLEARRLGADGFISALANIYPEAFLRIWQGDEAAQARVDRLRAAVKGYGGTAALKHLLTARGFPSSPTRLPFSELDPSARAALDRLLAEDNDA
jgi:4-hydroxy-tetrahydrodipicolinate synthase/2-dehydro-3-deoxy-phosphogluconate/2-dehydro-3-deoxy-6-phosphogalactonate aldolase